MPILQFYHATQLQIIREHFFLTEVYTFHMIYTETFLIVKIRCNTLYTDLNAILL